MHPERSTTPEPIAPAATAVTAFVGASQDGPVERPIRIRSFGEFARVFGGLSRQRPMTYAVSQFFANGGSEALVLRLTGARPSLTDDDVSAPTLASPRRGLWALEKSDGFNLLCVPPLTFTSDIGPSTRAAAAALARACRAFYLADPLISWTNPADVLGARGLDSRDWGLERSENAALYFPRLRVSDPLLGGTLSDFAPCGAVAGVYARTDAARGVWKAPAGTEATLTDVADLAFHLNDAQQSALHAQGVNALRSFPAGRVIWGARTLRGADGSGSDWKYIPVRRLALFLEDSVSRGTSWAQFEPNGELLWTKIRVQVENFLMNLFRDGALQGIRPNEAFFVKCDRDTMSQDDVDHGRINIMVGFAPLKPAEFVVIAIRQIAAGGRASGDMYG